MRIVRRNNELGVTLMSLALQKIYHITWNERIRSSLFSNLDLSDICNLITSLPDEELKDVLNDNLNIHQGVYFRGYKMPERICPDTGNWETECNTINHFEDDGRYKVCPQDPRADYYRSIDSYDYLQIDSEFAKEYQLRDR